MIFFRQITKYISRTNKFNIFFFNFFTASVGALVCKFQLRKAGLSLSLSRDNQTLFVGLIDGQIQKWNMTQAPPKWTFQSNDGNSTITSVCALDQVS